MKLYFAPMEGITTYIYRNTHAELFGCCDEYYAPFIAPSENERITRKSLKDVLPENNKNITLKVQVLTNKSEAFKNFAPKIEELGYDEININLGCPSGTVVNKGRGAGFLRYPDELHKFLGEIFENNKIKISLKTRIGFESGHEMTRLCEIYNNYPISELIVHPRVRQDFYKGYPDYKVFEQTYKVSKSKVCYNGNIYTLQDYHDITKKFDNLSAVMIGRGAITNPGIFREIKTGQKLTKADMVEFTELLAERYNKILDSDIFTLHKLKEIWIYAIDNFLNSKKAAKAMKKTDRLTDFLNSLHSLPEIEY